MGQRAPATRDRARRQHIHPSGGRPARDPAVCAEVAPALRKAVASERKAAGTRTKEETKTEVARKGGKSFLL